MIPPSMYLLSTELKYVGAAEVRRKAFHSNVSAKLVSVVSILTTASLLALKKALKFIHDINQV